MSPRRHWTEPQEVFLDICRQEATSKLVNLNICSQYNSWTRDLCSLILISEPFFVLPCCTPQLDATGQLPSSSWPLPTSKKAAACQPRRDFVDTKHFSDDSDEDATGPTALRGFWGSQPWHMEGLASGPWFSYVFLVEDRDRYMFHVKNCSGSWYGWILG